jgi:hypothetical protein
MLGSSFHHFDFFAPAANIAVGVASVSLASLIPPTYSGHELLREMDKFNIQTVPGLLLYSNRRITRSYFPLGKTFQTSADITAAVFRVKVIPFWYLGNHPVSPFSYIKGWR